MLELVLGLFASGLGRLADGRLAFGGGPFDDLGSLPLEGGAELGTQRRHDTLECGFELICCHEASSDYTAPPDKSLTLLMLRVKAGCIRSMDSAS